MKALVIDEPWITAILKGEKTWEMRKRNCKIRGEIALIRKGSGLVVGTAHVVELQATDCNARRLCCVRAETPDTARAAGTGIHRWMAHTVGARKCSPASEGSALQAPIRRSGLGEPRTCYRGSGKSPGE